MATLTRITAYVAKGAEAYVALERDLSYRGESDAAIAKRLMSGKNTVGEIWHTSDHGTTWRALPWRRAARVFVSPGVFARWPPDWVNRMWLDGDSLAIEVRDDWGWGTDWHPIWHATWSDDHWRVRFERRYRSEIDGPMPPLAIELDLPGFTRPPALGPFR